MDASTGNDDFSSDEMEVGTFQTEENEPIPTQKQTLSLFPAYESDIKSAKEDCTEKQQFANSGLEWLSNVSFQVPPDVFSNQIHPAVVENRDETTTEREVPDVKERRKDRHKKKKFKEKTSKKDRKLTAEVKTILKKDEDESDESSIYGILAKKVFIEETGLALERAYRIDKKPDRNNLAFKTFYHQHIAKYYQKPCPYMGISSQSEKVWYLLHAKKKRKRDKARYFSRESTANLLKARVVSVLSGAFAEKNLVPPNQRIYDYLPLETSFKKSRYEAQSETNPLGIYDASTDLYLQGKGQKLLEGSEVDITPWQIEIHQKTESFNKSLRENPENEDLWLDFVAFQDQAMSLDPYGNVKTMGKSRDIACLEKKLAILDRAVTDNPQSFRLAMARLRVCEGLWETDRVLNEWKTLSFKHPNQPSVWLNYLLFVQSNLTYFTVAKASKVYVKCLGTLSNILEGTFISHSPPPDLEERMLEIFYQYCHMLKESGYEERAVATFQALIELNLFTPLALSEEDTLSDWLTFFEPFWDSGVARFGEKDAKGWLKVVEDTNAKPGSSLSFSDLGPVEDEIIEKKLPKWGTWLQFELLRQQHHWFPWRPNVEAGKEEDCEDPERMVTVDDVLGLMFRLRSEATKFSLLLHFLRFCGFQSDSHQHSAGQKSACSNQATITELASIFSSSTLRISEKDEPFCDVLSLPTTVERQDLPNFVSNMLLQTRNSFSNVYTKQLTVLWVRHGINSAFIANEGNLKKFRCQLKDLKKKVKSLLRDETDLELWALFGTLGWILGDFDEVHRVFETALSVRSSTTDDTKEDFFRFSKKYIDLLLGNDCYVSRAGLTCQKVDRKRLLWVLAHLGSGEQHRHFTSRDVSAVLLLKAKKGFESLLDELMDGDFDSGSRPLFLTDCVACFSYFLYFSQSFHAAKSVYERVIEKVTVLERDTSSIRESIFSSYLQLLSFHVLHNIASLSTIRPTLERALVAFPSNPDFLRLLLDLEGGAYIAGRIRRFVSRIVNLFSELNPVFWYHVICGELKRLKMLKNFITEDGSEPNALCETGTTWKIRSLFETALKSSQHCPLLWRLYMKFENDYGNASRVKAVFYRALRKCPWTKALYVDALCYQPEDLQEIMDLMGEKELRIRTPLEEIELLMQHEESPPGGGEVVTIQDLDDR